MRKRNIKIQFGDFIIGFLIFIILMIIIDGLYKIIVLNSNNNSIYYIMLFVVMLILVFVLALKKEIKNNICLLILTAGIFTYLGEYLLSYVRPITGFQEYAPQLVENAKKNGFDFDKRTQVGVVKDLRATGINAYPTIYPHWFKYDLTAKGSFPGNTLYPFSGLANVTTVFCNELGTFVKYTSDKYGFRNNPDVYSAVPDIAIVGDSFAHGACVDYEDSIAGNLEKSGFKVANFAIAGNGPLIEYATIREYVAKMKPRILLWAFYEGNDLSNLYSEAMNPMLIRYLKDPSYSQNLSSRTDEINYVLKNYIFNAMQNINSRKAKILNVLLLRHLRIQINNLFKLNSNSESVENDIRFPVAIEYLKGILLEARNEIKNWGGIMYFVYIPTHSRYLPCNDKELSKKDPYRKRELLSYLNDSGFKVIDLDNLLSSQTEYHSLIPGGNSLAGGHFNPKGYNLISNYIYEKVRPDFQFVKK